MNRGICALVSGLFCAAMVGGAYAASDVATETTTSNSLSLKSAFARAAVARLNIRIAEEDIQAARARVEQARARYYPTLDLTTNVDYINNFDSFSGTTASVYIPQVNLSSSVTITQSVPRHQTTGGLQLKYGVYTGGRDSALLNQTELNLSASDLSRRIALQGVAQDVSTAYFKLRQACLKRDRAGRRLVAAGHAAELANQRLRDGRIAEIEQRAAGLAKAESESALRVSEADLNTAFTEYAFALGDARMADGGDTRCQFATDIESDLGYAASLSDDSVKDRYRQVLVLAADKQVDAERAAAKPQVSVYAGYTGIGRSESSFGGAASSFEKRQANVGLQISLNLFDGFLTQQRVVESLSVVNRRKLEAESEIEARNQARKRAEIQVRISIDQLELARARLDLARSRAALASAKRDSGTGSASALEEQKDHESDAADEVKIAELNLALARVNVFFPPSGL